MVLGFSVLAAVVILGSVPILSGGAVIFPHALGSRVWGLLCRICGVQGFGELFGAEGAPAAAVR